MGKLRGRFQKRDSFAAGAGGNRQNARLLMANLPRLASRRRIAEGKFLTHAAPGGTTDRGASRCDCTSRHPQQRLPWSRRPWRACLRWQLPLSRGALRRSRTSPSLKSVWSNCVVTSRSRPFQLPSQKATRSSGRKGLDWLTSNAACRPCRRPLSLGIAYQDVRLHGHHAIGRGG